MTKLKIPEFKSLEEAAEYWDTHSFADYMDDTKPIEIEVRLKGHKIILEIDYELSDKLTKIARGKKQSCQILETFYYFLITTYYYLCISQTIYAALAFPEQIKKSQILLDSWIREKIQQETAS